MLLLCVVNLLFSKINNIRHLVIVGDSKIIIHFVALNSFLNLRPSMWNHGEISTSLKWISWNQGLPCSASLRQFGGSPSQLGLLVKLGWYVIEWRGCGTLSNSLEGFLHAFHSHHVWMTIILEICIYPFFKFMIVSWKIYLRSSLPCFG